MVVSKYMYIIYGYISGMEITKSSLTLLCEFAFDGNVFILTFFVFSLSLINDFSSDLSGFFLSRALT